MAEKIDSPYIITSKETEVDWVMEPDRLEFCRPDAKAAFEEIQEHKRIITDLGTVTNHGRKCGYAGMDPKAGVKVIGTMEEERFFMLMEIDDTMFRETNGAAKFFAKYRDYAAYDKDFSTR